MISASVRPYLQPRPLRFPGTFLLSEADFGAGAMTDFFQTSSVGGEIVAVNKLLHLPSVVIVGTTMFLAIIELMLWHKKGPSMKNVFRNLPYHSMIGAFSILNCEEYYLHRWPIRVDLICTACNRFIEHEIHAVEDFAEGKMHSLQ